MDVFSDHSYSPMLIAHERTPFDDPEWTFELKLDGIRCLAYLDGHSTTLISRSGRDSTSRFPELTELHRQVSRPCVIDGELILLEDGVPSFKRIMERALSDRPDRIIRAAKNAPATFVAFDILYHDKQDVTKSPLQQRLPLLDGVIAENDRIIRSRRIPERGEELFAITVAQGLEGIVGKRNDSIYLSGKRTDEWVKIKNVHDDDFIVCGYVVSPKHVTSLVLGQYDSQGGLVYAGHVVINSSSSDFARIKALPRVPKHRFSAPIPASNDHAIWVELTMVCSVEFLSRTESGATRHPVFKGLRSDKRPAEVMLPAEG